MDLIFLSERAIVMAKFCAILFLMFLLFAVTSCSGSTGNCKICSTRSSYNIRIDKISPIPLINGEAQDFYVYATNVGTSDATGLVWSLSDDINTTPQSIFEKIKSIPKSLSTNCIIIDPNSNCSEIAVGVSCALKLRGVIPDGAKLIISSSSGSSVATTVLNTYTYQVPAVVNPDSILTISPLTAIANSSGDYAGYLFFIINNGSNSTVIDDDLFLTASQTDVVKYSKIETNCPNPLPKGKACQVRLLLKTTAGSNLEQNIQLIPKGYEVDSSGTKTPLPEQKTYSINLSTTQKGILTPGVLENLIVNSSDELISVDGILTNTGTANLTINSMSVSSTDANLTADKCLNKTLKPNDTCAYTISVVGSQLHSSGQGVVLVNYDNGLSPSSYSINTSWKYSRLKFTPRIITTIMNDVNSLSLTRATATLVIQNTGDVELESIAKPTVQLTAPSTAQVKVGDATGCTFPLAIGYSCSYLLTYVPVNKKSDNNVLARVSDVNVTYIGANNTISSINLATNTSLLVNATYLGIANLNNDNTIVDANTNNTITIKNAGNNDIVLTNPILASNTNLAIDSTTTCKAGTLLVAKAGISESSCIITLKLSNPNLIPAYVTESLNLSYTNGSGNANSALSTNVSWNIGSNPILDVSFASSNLSAKVNATAEVAVSLENKGNIPLANITLPTNLTNGLSLVAAGCNVVNGKIASLQNTRPNNKCGLKLRYTPTSITPGPIGTYLGNNNGSNNVFTYESRFSPGIVYSSSNYSLTLSALDNSNSTSFIESSGINTITQINQTNTWVIGENRSTLVKLRNNNTGAIVITGISSISSPGNINTSGCGVGTSVAGKLSCDLIITNSYGDSMAGSGSVTVNYTENGVALSNTLLVDVSAIPKPIINKSLGISLSPNSNLGLAKSAIVDKKFVATLLLSNNTNVTNPYTPNQDGEIQIDEASLLVANTTPVNQISLSSLNNQNTDSNKCIVLNGKIELPMSRSCSYRINISSSSTSVITTSVQGGEIKPSYSYNDYTNTSTTPVSLNVLNSTLTAINYNIYDPQFILSSVNSIPTNPTLQVEKSTGEYTVSYSVTNDISSTDDFVGNIRVSPSTPLPTGFSLNVGDCANLAVGKTCTFSITMTTDNLIALGNLNLIKVGYSTAIGDVYTQLPSTLYQVSLANAPIIDVSVKVDNCMSGDFKTTPIQSNLSVLKTCDINTGNLAPIMHVIFTNTGTGEAKNFTIESALLVAAIIGKNYNQISNTCTDKIVAINGVCELTINPNTQNATTESQTAYDITYNNNNTTIGYSYKYGSKNQNSVVNQTASVGVDASIVNPIVEITSPTGVISVTPGSIYGVQLNIAVSSWYYNTPSHLTLSYRGSTPATGFSPSSCTLENPVNNSSAGICNLIVDRIVPVGSYNVDINGNNMTGKSKILDVITPQSFAFNGPEDITIAGARAYIVNYLDNSVTKCTYDSNDNSFNSCINSGATGLNGPLGITITGTYAYITNSNDASVTKCSYDVSNGSLWACINSRADGLIAPDGITIDGNNAYIVNYGSSSVTKCTYNNSTGELSFCQNSGVTGLSSASGITILGSNIYVVNSSSIIKCAYDSSTGAISSCGNSGATGLVNAHGIAIAGAYAYIANNSTNIITKCSCDATTGVLSSCLNSGASGLSGPSSIIITGSYAFITSYNNSKLYRCSIDSTTGDLSSCAISGLTS